MQRIFLDVMSNENITALMVFLSHGNPRKDKYA